MSKAEFETFSPKQLTALSWWHPASPYSRYDALICDGAVRSGKTTCMSLSFIIWSFYKFDDTSFALCGKTVTALKRNIVIPLLSTLRRLGFDCKEKLSQNLIIISYKNKTNRYYLFGGKDEGSAALIQGMTLGGVLLDEVALMPRSFTEQALARCSLEGSKFWFNCNPESPSHWFYEQWIKKAEEKNCLYLHFLMQDNPSLGEDILRRYENLYSGAFYERFVLGRWVAASGLVYPEVARGNYTESPRVKTFDKYYISCDYGTVNPTSMGLWGLSDGVWYRFDEFYYNSRQEGSQLTDEEYYEKLVQFSGTRNIEAVIIDPSAASFIECIRRHGKFRVIKAKNDVTDGIRKVHSAFRQGQIIISPVCKAALKEFSLYRWDENKGNDVPRKENDHAMDEIRYFVSTVLSQETHEDFFCSFGRKVLGKENILAIRKRKNEPAAPEAVAVTQTGNNTHPFVGLTSYTPEKDCDFALYKSLREAIPIIDAAIMKTVRLLGSFKVLCEDDKAQEYLDDFLNNVNVSGTSQGIDAFVSSFFEQLITYGTAVGEMVVSNGELTHLYNSDLRSVLLSHGSSPLDIVVSSDCGYGNFKAVSYPQLILFASHNPDPGKIYGNSVLKGLPFVSEILLKIYNTIGINWERLGNVRFAVTYKPQNDAVDKAYAKERALQVANEWSRTMQSGSTVRDFVAVGDVSVKAIGADNQILDSEVPVRQLLEQIIAKLGIPPFLLGLSWSSTERMSYQQADILTSEIDYYRREITPIIRKICRTGLNLAGYSSDFTIKWDNITLQDISELAKSDYYQAQTQQILSKIGGDTTE